MPISIALDLGTTSVRAIAFDVKSEVIAISQKEIAQHFPKPGWVEHDALEILALAEAVLKDVVQAVSPSNISAIGITNQRETTVLWNKTTGQPIHNAIVWQCRRTADRCTELQSNAPSIQSKTGLRLDPYFSATKIEWLLDHVPNARAQADAGDLLFGTIDTWILWNLSQKRVHATDFSNASRTMLYNIHEQAWDDDLLALFNIPSTVLPDVRDSDAHFTDIKIGDQTIPIHAMIGDQQAALFTQCGEIPGRFKNTYGTGLFVMTNTGSTPVQTENLITTIAWKRAGTLSYALEGPIFGGGSMIQWVRDNLGLISNAQESEALANSLEDNEGVFFIPALSGLGAPHWTSTKTGEFKGLTLKTTKSHLVRAVLESIAYQTREVSDELQTVLSDPPTELYIDGGATNNTFLMQFQADVLNMPLNQHQTQESTALGAAAIAAIAVGEWTEDQFRSSLSVIKTVTPQPDVATEKQYQSWKRLLAL